MLRKSNFKILTLIILGMVFTISFLSYKIYLEKKYDTSEYKLRYKKFCELYENKAEKRIVYSNNYLKTINFKEINFGDILGEYKIEEESDIHKVYTNDDKMIYIGKMRKICDTDVFKFEEKISMSNLCESEGIVSNLDFFKYMYKYRNKKMNIFSTKNTIQKNWAFTDMIFNITSDDYKKITILKGDLTGYVFEADNITEIFLSRENDEYFISLKNVNNVNHFLESIYFS